MLMKQRRFVWRMTRAIKKTKRPKQTNQDADIDECSVCILPLELPVRLQCGHVFCFTCARGLLKTTKCCALCRAEISMELATNSKMFLVGALPKPTAKKYSWFYESRTGWWLFAPRMQTDIENAFKSGQKSLKTVINGQTYILDFRKMVQTFASSRWETTQRIKKDLSSSSHLGVAGLEYC
ncbi:E3 ubiquitin-protein ligase RNF146-B-like [Cloeon dipterum]|uniref:E3 ubiquitin-protein ligase RNF146-B-like n=1 Tax=Cloeon dipterum TaxID=197152 RepID=UPI00322002A6